jgi:hypothetical protein
MFNAAIKILRVIEGAMGSYLRDSSRIYTYEPEWIVSELIFKAHIFPKLLPSGFCTILAKEGFECETSSTL